MGGFVGPQSLYNQPYTHPQPSNYIAALYRNFQHRAMTTTLSTSPPIGRRVGPHPQVREAMRAPGIPQVTLSPQMQHLQELQRFQTYQQHSNFRMGVRHPLVLS
jgi:hypothetical protein